MLDASKLAGGTVVRHHAVPVIGPSSSIAPGRSNCESATGRRSGAACFPEHAAPADRRRRARLEPFSRSRFDEPFSIGRRHVLPAGLGGAVITLLFPRYPVYRGEMTINSFT